MTTHVKDLGKYTQIAHYRSRDYPAEILFVPEDEVDGLISDLVRSRAEK